MNIARLSTNVEIFASKERPKKIIFRNAYGKEYLQISNDTGACMSDRVQPSEPVSYIDLIQLSDNICTVAEHAKESIPFQLTADEFCLVTGVDIYKSNLQEDKK